MHIVGGKVGVVLRVCWTHVGRGRTDSLHAVGEAEEELYEGEIEVELKAREEGVGGACFDKRGRRGRHFGRS